MVLQGDRAAQEGKRGSREQQCLSGGGVQEIQRWRSSHFCMREAVHDLLEHGQQRGIRIGTTELQQHGPLFEFPGQ